MTIFEELAYSSEQQRIDLIARNNPLLVKIIATQPEGSVARRGALNLVARMMYAKTNEDFEQLAREYPDFVFMGTPSKLGLVPMYGLKKAAPDQRRVPTALLRNYSEQL